MQDISTNAGNPKAVHITSEGSTSSTRLPLLFRLGVTYSMLLNVMDKSTLGLWKSILMNLCTASIAYTNKVQQEGN